MIVLTPTHHAIEFRTCTNVSKLGVMLVGWGGNNGTTFTAGILANKLGLGWQTKDGKRVADYYGSLTQCGTTVIGCTDSGEELSVPIKSLLPMANPNDIVISGWDINGNRLGDAMMNAKVLDFDLQCRLYSEMQNYKPLPGIYIPNFIASNQSERVNNTISGTHWEMVNKIREDIREFRNSNELSKVIVMWTATTERFSEGGDEFSTSERLIDAVYHSDSKISPSTLYAVAAVLEDCHFINGSPQNTIVPGVVELAKLKGVFVAGNDFKTG